MHSIRRNFIISSLVVITLTAIAALGYSTWSLAREVSSLRGHSEAQSDVLEELDEMARQQALQDRQQGLLTPWASIGGDPFAQFQTMQDEMRRLFQHGPTGNHSTFEQLFGNAAAISFAQPEIALEESEHEYRVVITLAPDTDIELDTAVEDNVLSIKALIRQELTNQSANSRSNSSSFSQIARNFNLNKPVDATGLATQKDTDKIVITIPKLV